MSADETAPPVAPAPDPEALRVDPIPLDAPLPAPPAEPATAPPRIGRPLVSLIVPLTEQELRSPPPPLRYLVYDSDARGVLLRSVVGMLGAPGGTGKTHAVIGLTVAVATGGKWFDVWPCEQGRVLLVLAETTPEQVKRRLHWYLRDVPAAPMAAALANITPLAAAGAGGLALIHDGDTSTGDLPETVRAVELRDILKAAVAERHPYSLVVLDPSVRFAGAHSEKDNGAATRYVEVLETLALPECGAPTVLLPAHTRKPTERSKDAAPGSTDALRGASGLRDAVRWVGMLEERRGIDGAPRLLDLKVGKANDAHKPSIVLCADDDREGALRAATLEEIDTYDAVTGKRKSARGDDLRAEVLKALEAGSMSGRVLAEQLHRNRDHLRPVMEQLQREGKVVSQPGPKRATVWSLAAPTADAEAEHAAAVLLGGSPHAP